jgi:hypothetical protein
MRNDIVLLCENALSFNEEDSVYFQTAGKLLGELDGLFEDAKVRLALPSWRGVKCADTFSCG